MRPLDLAAFTALRWSVEPEHPVLRPPFPSPVLADPTFRGPDESPDGRWHLFAHSILGIHHATSSDGVAWSRPRLRIRAAMRPFLHDEAGRFHLFYERILPLRLLLPWLRLPWRSWIECRTSDDLIHWSAPTVVLRPTEPWHRRESGGMAVGNPCALRLDDGRYALYFSSSLVRLPDCGFDEPLHIGLATADRPTGPYRVHPRPILSPRADDPRCNLGAGSIKVIRLGDGFAGLQNGIYRDPGSGASGSAISVLTSADGIEWTYAHTAPILAPAAGWRRSFIYACDARPRPDGTWVLYFNARDGWHWTSGREAIGRAVGLAPGAGGRRVNPPASREMAGPRPVATRPRTEAP